MTYKDLYNELGRYLYHSFNLKNAKSQEKQTVTVYIKELDEWYAVEKLCVTTEADVLDEGHLYLETN